MMIMKKILITLILCLKMSNFVESKKSNIEDSSSSDNVRGDPTPIFKFVAKDDSLSSHREFGNVIGNTFKDKIVARLSQDSDLANAYEYCVNTSKGKQVYEEFLDAHERVYPKYVEVSFDYDVRYDVVGITLYLPYTSTHTIVTTTGTSRNRFRCRSRFSKNICKEPHVCSFSLSLSLTSTFHPPAQPTHTHTHTQPRN
jgi:hypothetical protein